MDYTCPVESLVPGARGKILAASLRSGTPQTMSALATLAGVSRNQGSLVLGELEALGLVERVLVGRAHLVNPVEESPVVEALRHVLRLRELTLDRWRTAAALIRPDPCSVSVYGSWARGQATTSSDVDVLVILPTGIDDDGLETLHASLEEWSSYAMRVCGLPMSLVIVSEDEASVATGPFWTAIRRDAVLITGRDPREVCRAA